MRTRIVWTMMLLALITQAKEKNQSEPVKQDKGKEESASPTSEAQATVYVYRYKQFVGSALAPSVYCDETELARMDNGRYFKVKLKPGKHTFRSNDKQSGIEMDLKNGEDYYIRVELATGFWKGHGRLALVPKEQGAYEINKLKPIDAEKIKDGKTVMPDKQPKGKP